MENQAAYACNSCLKIQELNNKCKSDQFRDTDASSIIRQAAHWVLFGDKRPLAACEITTYFKKRASGIFRLISSKCHDYVRIILATDPDLIKFRSNRSIRNVNTRSTFYGLKEKEYDETVWIQFDTAVLSTSNCVKQKIVENEADCQFVTEKYSQKILNTSSDKPRNNDFFDEFSDIANLHIFTVGEIFPELQRPEIIDGVVQDDLKTGSRDPLALLFAEDQLEEPF